MSLSPESGDAPFEKNPQVPEVKVPYFTCCKAPVFQGDVSLSAACQRRSAGAGSMTFSLIKVITKCFFLNLPTFRAEYK